MPSAPDAAIVRTGLAPYIDMAYLHHGYFFFAPNPGPSHLMDIQLTYEDGNVRHLRLPDHQAQWPRLLYHRHFMLSEFLYQLYRPALSTENGDATQLDPAMREAWYRERKLFERVRGSMEQHLATRYGAKKAEIQLMEHRLPNAVEVFDQKIAINDERLYMLLPDQPQSPGDGANLPQSFNAPRGNMPLPPLTSPGPVFPNRNPSTPGTESVKPPALREPTVEEVRP